MPGPDATLVATYKLGKLDGLKFAEKMARQDCRNALAKKYNFVPGWQKGRWQAADELANLIAELEKAR